MKDQWKEDFEKFMESLYNGVSLKELMREYLKSLLAEVPYFGNYFSAALSSYDHALQMVALFKIFGLSKEFKDEIEEFHQDEIDKINEIISILEREGRQYERDRLPYQIFLSHQIDEVKGALRFSPPGDIRSHIERCIEKNELEDYMILAGKIGAGKTTSLIKIVERSKPDLIVVIKNNIRAIGTEKLYDIDYLGKCVVIWDDIQNSVNEFLKAVPILRELRNIKFIGAIRSTDYGELEKDKYFREIQFRKIEVEELNEEEVEELVELLEKEFDKPLENLRHLFIEKVMEADGTPFYIVSVFLNPEPFTDRLIKTLPEELTEIWSKYFLYLDSSQRCVIRTLRMIRENYGIPEEEFVRNVYNKAFHGNFNDFYVSLENLERMRWILTEYFEPLESRIITSKDAQLFCFEMNNLEVEDFYECLCERDLEPKEICANILLVSIYSLLDNENYEKSEKLANRLLELDSQSPLAHMGRGSIYLKLKRFNDAIKDFDKAIELDIELVPAYNNRGLVYSKLKEFDKALEDYNKAIELNPKLAEAYVSRGFVYYELEEFDKAMEDYNKAMELDPEFGAAYNNRGLVYSELEEFDKAMEDYNTALELGQKHAETYYNRGLVYFKLEEFDKATREFDKAIELNPKLAEAYLNRGAVYMELKRLDDAINDFDKAIELNPKLVESYIGRGNFYGELKRFEDAIRDYDKAIELDSTIAAAYYNRGRTYFELGRSDDAIKDFDKAIELDPKYAQSYSRRGGVYFKLERFDDAMKDFDKAIELDPELAEVYNNRGSIHLGLKRFEDAMKDFDKAIELDPELAEVYNNRGSVFLDLKRFDDAMKDFDKAIDLNPKLAEAYASRGSVYSTLGRFEDAIEEYTKAIESNSDIAEAYVIRGYIYHTLNRPNEAMNDFSEAFRISVSKENFGNILIVFRNIFYDLLDLDVKFCIKNGVYAISMGYLEDYLDLELLNDVWAHRFFLDESPEKIIIYFFGGISGFEEDIFSLENSVKNGEYLRILSETIQSLREGNVTQNLEKSILRTEKNTAEWNLLLLCLKKFLK